MLKINLHVHVAFPSKQNRCTVIVDPALIFLSCNRIWTLFGSRKSTNGLSQLVKLSLWTSWSGEFKAASFGDFVPVLDLSFAS